MKAPPAGGMRGRLKLLLTLCGLSAGIGSAVVIERQLLEGGPVGWDLVHPDIPLLPQASCILFEKWFNSCVQRM